MRRGGACLAALHGCGVPGEVRTMVDDMHDLHEYTAAMEKVKPKLAADFEAAIQAIRTRWTA